MENTVDPYKAITSTRLGSPPLTLKLVTTPNNFEFAGGVPQSATKVETYVLYSALPDELKERIKVAVQALASSI